MKMKQIVLCIAMGVFALSQLSFAQEETNLDAIQPPAAAKKGKEAAKQPLDIFSLTVPKSWGTIKEVYKGSTDKVIVYIQDAHCNYECQNNIAKIVDRLVTDYGLTVAGVEGSAGKILTDLYATYPEDTVRQRASDYFVREGVFTGPEALIITKGFEYPLHLYGIEDEKLYNNNLEAFKASLPFKNETKENFGNLNRILGQLKTCLYSPEISKFDEKQLAFALNMLTLNDYCLFLVDELARKQVSVDEYPVFAKLVKAIGIEKEIDFIKAEEERTKLLTELTNILPENDIRALLDKGLAYKNESIPASAYLAQVKELAVNNKVDFSAYKNLDKYIEYAKAYEGIKSFEIFNEIEDIDSFLRSKIYTNEDQKKLDLFLKGLRVMGRLVEIKMVNKDLKFYKEHQDELKADKYLNFIREQTSKYGIAANVPMDISYLDVYIPAWVEFYRVAGLRDQAMIKNTLKIMQDNNQKTGIMITGGFHTRELTRLMRMEEISYIIITPVITKNVPGPYFNRLTGKKTEWEAFLGEFNAVTPAQKTTQ